MQMPSYMMEGQENRIWEYRCQKGPEILDKEHCQQEKISEFQELLHPKNHLDRLWMNTNDSTFQDAFFQLFQLFGQLGLCGNILKDVTKAVIPI